MLDITYLLDSKYFYVSKFFYVVLVYYSDVIMGAIASQITIFTIVYPTVYSGIDQRNHQSSTSPAFVSEIHRWPVNSPHE